MGLPVAGHHGVNRERSCVNTGCCTDGCLSERNRDSKEQPRNTDFRTQLLNFGRTVAGAG